MEEVYTFIKKIYPNPTDGFFTLEFETNGIYNLTISDLNGRIMKRETVTGQTVQMNISNFSSGMYLLMINDGKRQMTMRIVRN